MKRARGLPAARRSWKQRAVIAIGGTLAVVLAIAAGAVGFVYWKTGQFRRVALQLDPTTTIPSAPSGPVNYLIIGSDSRANIDPNASDASAFVGGGTPGGQRADTIIIARLDPGAATIQLLSIPRDLYVPLAGTGQTDRINSAFGQGPQRLIDTIRADFGIPINHYIHVDFRGFEGVVNALGGVSYYAPTGLRDDNTGLDIPAPGCVALNGEQALALARARHLSYLDSRGRWVYDPTSDIGRMARQQALLRAALRKALTLDITDVTTAYGLLDSAVHSLTVDQSIGRSELLALAQQFRHLDPNTVAGTWLPAHPYTTSGGADVLLLDNAAARPMLNVFRGLPADAIAERDIHVHVSAPTTALGIAAVGQLQSGGFATDPTSTTAHARAAQPEIRYPAGSETAADLLARHLTSPAILRVDNSLPADTVTYVVGTDGTTIAATASPTAVTTSTTGPVGLVSPASAADVGITTTTAVGVAAPPTGSPCAA